MKKINRRDFIKHTLGSFAVLSLSDWPRLSKSESSILNDIYWIRDIPDQPFTLPESPHSHAGIDALLNMMGTNGLKFFRSTQETTLSGPSGLIDTGDIVLIKVNAQWKYRGCTNSDVIRGLIQKILQHPDHFTGEVVIIENGQGRGSLNCDTYTSYQNSEVHANANDESHSFTYLVDTIFNDYRVSYYLFDPIRSIFIGENDHSTDGYRTYENISYPCFITARRHRIELQKGVWNGSSYDQNLKLINVPVLKHHDTGGSEITESLKHMYGVVSMADGQSSFRHYSGLGETCGKMMVSVHTPVLNIMDAIWVSHSSLKGYQENTTHRSNQLMASQDPVALDYLAAKGILFPVDHNNRHHPDFSGIDKWLNDSKEIINTRGGLKNTSKGILVDEVTKSKNEMQVYSRRSLDAPKIDFIGSWDSQGIYYQNSDSGEWVKIASPGESIAAGDVDGDGIDDLIGIWPGQGGVWVKYSSTGSWKNISSKPECVATGKLRNAQGSSAEGPSLNMDHEDLSSEGPWGWNFVYKKEKNLIPKETKRPLLKKHPGPGEFGFRYIEQSRLVPYEK